MGRGGQAVSTSIEMVGQSKPFLLKFVLIFYFHRFANMFLQSTFVFSTFCKYVLLNT